jgi:EKC/KEOPS complex subunit CGI121/TPRKB
MASSIIHSCLYPGLAHVHTVLFLNVTNATQIKKRIVAAATTEGPIGEQEREAVNFAFIDARLVRLP